MHNVIPGILDKNFVEIEKKLEIIRSFSKTVHIDFLDGKFSPETSFMDFNSFVKYKEDFYLEAHLMTENPAQYIRQLAAVGFKRFIGHIVGLRDNCFYCLGGIYQHVHGFRHSAGCRHPPGRADCVALGASVVGAPRAGRHTG